MKPATRAVVAATFDGPEAIRAAGAPTCVRRPMPSGSPGVTIAGSSATSRRPSVRMARPPTVLNRPKALPTCVNVGLASEPPRR